MVPHITANRSSITPSRSCMKVATYLASFAHPSIHRGMNWTLCRSLPIQYHLDFLFGAVAVGCVVVGSDVVAVPAAVVAVARPPVIDTVDDDDVVAAVAVVVDSG